MSHSVHQWMFVIALAAVATSCSGSDEKAVPIPATPAPAAAAPTATASQTSAKDEAKKIFTERCITCHGPNGAGDGPASAGLEPKPRNFQDRDWQKSVSDEHIEQIVQYGGAAVGRSAAMPSNPDLMSKPEVVVALREYVRSLSK